MNVLETCKALANPRVGVMLPLGFASGLPLALTGQTLQAWLTTENIALGTIGIFAMVGVPYTLKFLWAPLMDRFVPPLLGRRRGWIAVTQLLLAIGVAAMALIGPYIPLWLLGVLALSVALSSASQDIAFDAYRTDLLKSTERGFGAGVSVMGYRVAMLTSGALALLLADVLGWKVTYLVMAALMLISVAVTFFSPEPVGQTKAPASLIDAIQGPVRDFFSRPAALWLLLFIVLYKLGDAFAGILSTSFLLRGMGFSLTDVGLVNKGIGVAVTIFGALVGGALMVRLSLYQALMIFGILQAVSNLAFMFLAWIGKSYPALVMAVTVENLAGGMGTAAFVAFLMSLCHVQFTATQYALLSALSAIGRVFVASPSGFLVESVGWVTFFFFTFLTALPGLVLLWWLRESISTPGSPQETSA